MTTVPTSRNYLCMSRTLRVGDEVQMHGNWSRVLAWTPATPERTVTVWYSALDPERGQGEKVRTLTLVACKAGDYIDDVARGALLCLGVVGEEVLFLS